nr:Protein SNF-1 [Haemonchus contortus]
MGGAHRLGMDLHVMLRNACCWCFGHFVLLFTYLLPVIPAAVALLNLHDYDFSTFSPAIHSWPYSEWLGAAVALGPLLPIPLVLFFTILCACCCRGKQGYTRGQRLRNVFASNLRRDQRDKSRRYSFLVSSSYRYFEEKFMRMWKSSWAPITSLFQSVICLHCFVLPVVRRTFYSSALHPVPHHLI